MQLSLVRATKMPDASSQRQHSSTQCSVASVLTCRETGFSPCVAPAGRNEEGGSREGPRPSLGDPVQTVAWGGRLPSQRRAVLGGLAGVGIGVPLPRARSCISCMGFTYPEVPAS